MMLGKWTDKDDKLYKDVKQRARQDGADEGRARELAAQAVTRQREQEGRNSDHPSNPSMETEQRAPAHGELDTLSERELRNRAESMKIEGRENMEREQLIAAMRRQHP